LARPEVAPTAEPGASGFGPLAAKETPVPFDDLHFHDLRHHFASWFVMRGGSIQVLKETLGHADPKMTLRYAHLAPAHLRGKIVKAERRS
jgi:integrase